MPIIRIPARVPRGGKSIKGPMKRPKKGPKKPAPQRRRESSSSLSSPANLSDDGGYSAVEDVSDSDEDDEEHVYAAEVEHIISDELHHKRGATRSSPRPSSDLDEDDEAADADDDESDDNETSTPQKGRRSLLTGIDPDNKIVVQGSSSEAETWDGLSNEDEQPPYPVETTPADQSGTPVERHVRFAGLPDSGSDSDETDENHDNFFPDIFVTQDSLDPNFRREIERDDDNESDNYWDQIGGVEFEGFSEPGPQAEDPRGTNLHGILFVDEDDEVARMNGMMPDPATSSLVNSRSNPATEFAAQPTLPDVPMQEDDEESDGYESDGETTEEDEPVPLRIEIQTPRRRYASGGSSDSEPGRDNKPGDEKSPVARVPVRSRKKPICVLNPQTRKMMIFTPQKKRRFESHPGHLPSDYLSMPTTTDSSPIKPGYASQFTMGGNWSADTLMMPQVPFANDIFLTDPLQIRPASESSSLPDDEEDVEENNLDISDFISFSDSGSEGEVQGDDNADESNNDGVETPSRRPSDAPSADGNFIPSFKKFLDHFDKRPNAVGAFRLNQTHQKLILNGEATQESLAFSNPLFHGTLRGIKDGSLGGASTPLTPERRHKKKTSAKSPAEAAAIKRKASGMASDTSRAHKKQRSISDVSGMQL